jgi:D-methionine transport system permease protein
MGKQILSLLPDLGKAFWETFQMVGISLSLALLLGVPLGLLLLLRTRGFSGRTRYSMRSEGFL